ncbi:MAG: extracellular solute-binding protein [Anaerolineae bacterium]|nr:extracellular solute-binding protein [Anaerolineae bacterium]
MKRQTWKRVWASVVVVICVVTLLAGCTPAPKPTPTSAPKPAAATPKPASPTATPVPKEKVTLRWFMRWDKPRLENVAQPVIEAFEKEHPEIKVEIENIGSGKEYWIKLQTMVAGGTAPDVIYPATHNAYALASKGALMNLNPLAERDGLDLTKYDPTILDLYKYDGKLYGLPLDSAALVIFYNKKMFDEAGVAYPSDDWTWDDFLATAKKVTKDTDGDGKIDQFGIDNWTSYWSVIVWTKTGHGIFDDLRNPTKFLLDDDESIAALQWLADLTNVHHVMPSSAQRADIKDMFVAGKSAMIMIGHWRVPQYMANITDFDWDVAALPQGKVAANRCDGSCFAVTAGSKHPEEAWEFIKFLSGPGSLGVKLLLDLQQMTPALVEYQQNPQFLSPEALPGVNKNAFLAGKEHLFPNYDPIHPIYDEVNAAEGQELGELWNGNVTAQEMMERLVPQIEEILAGIQ